MWTIMYLSIYTTYEHLFMNNDIVTALEIDMEKRNLQDQNPPIDIIVSDSFYPVYCDEGLLIINSVINNK